METLILIFHVICCLILILAILLQAGKSADLAGAFGGMGSQQTFGPRGQATILSRMTTAAAVIFMVTSLLLTILLASHGVSSKMKGVAGGAGPARQTAPAKPGQQPAARPATTTVPVPATPQPAAK